MDIELVESDRRIHKSSGVRVEIRVSITDQGLTPVLKDWPGKLRLVLAIQGFIRFCWESVNMSRGIFVKGE